MGKAMLCALKICLGQQLPQQLGDILAALYEVTDERCHGRNQALVQALRHPVFSARGQPPVAVPEAL